MQATLDQATGQGRWRAVSARGGWDFTERSLLGQVPDPDLDLRVVLQQLDEARRDGCPVVVWVEDARAYRRGDLGHHLRRHRVGEVHGQERDVDTPQGSQFGRVLGITRDQHA